MAQTKNALRSDFGRARNVVPVAITGKEKPADIMLNAFPAYVGRQERTAFELMQKAVTEGHAIFTTMSGAMTPAGLHRSCIIPLMDRGIIDVLTTTGANLYHDAHRIIGHHIREIRPDAGDLQLRLARIIRIYDLGFWEEALLHTDMLFSALLMKPEFQKRMTTVELHWMLGREIAAIEDALGVKDPTLLATAYRCAIPIFVGAVQDGSIFLNMVKLKRLLGDAFKLEIDINDDVFEMGAIQYWARQNFEKKLAIWILGGGVPKNYTLQGEPLLDQILGVPVDGFDLDVQFCVDPVDNGALSSCPAGEGHTWGKVSVDAVEKGSIYVHCDVTAVFPWVTYALLSTGNVRRKHKRLYDQREQAVAFLQARVQKNRASLMKTLKMPENIAPALAPKGAGKTKGKRASKG